jgi:hypothetical protein
MQGEELAEGREVGTGAIKGIIPHQHQLVLVERGFRRSLVIEMLKPGLSVWILYKNPNNIWELIGIGSSETHLGPFRICVRLIRMQAHIVE